MDEPTEVDIEFCEGVTAKIKEPSFQMEHKGSRAPLAMLAFAGIVVEKIIRGRNDNLLHKYFDGMTITVPPSKEVMMAPHYHSLVGQQLLYVDWKRMFNIEVNCPRCPTGTLVNDRTNFSKNKILFPIFDLDGPPRWCMVMSMVCSCCRGRYHANCDEVLRQIPGYARTSYPVEPKYAQQKNSHIGTTATQVLDLLMPTYGNGDLCSRLLYNAMNRSYLEKVDNYYSFHKANYKSTAGIEVEPYVEKDGTYITAYPPTGDSIRDAYDKACSSRNNPWLLSDHDRHTREIQSVGSNLIFAQDHTHEVTKNYFQKKRLGANALWDAGTDTGEIACAVLVPSTKTRHFAHAAQQLANRGNFSPSVMYSDTWPSKKEFWHGLFNGTLQGRLGLFHYIQRVTRTLKKKHIDHFHAVNGLLNAIYKHNEEDHENVLKALKNGTLSGTKHTDDDIADLRASKAFRQRYDRYLRKEIRQPMVLQQMLDDWFDRFKCSSSNATRPARGRLDPITGETLFTPETKEAVMNCKEKACHLQDPLPLSQMYRVIPPGPNSTHGLNEYLSRRGESSLESFHLMLAHFGNCGMRTSLADNLNLTGTARHNLAIRHKILLTTENTDRVRRSKKMPAAFEDTVSFFNHTELQHINQMALAVGLSQSDLPFQNVEPLPKDNGERFFSEYLTWMRRTKPTFDAQDRCLCSSCYKQETTITTINSTMCPPAPAMAPATPATTTPRREATNASTDAQLANRSTNGFSLSADPPHRANCQLSQQNNVNNVVRANSNKDLLLVQPPTATQQFWPGFAPAFHLPMQWMYPTIPLATATYFCCGRYRQWCNTQGRRGRPPHDYHCRRLPVKK